MFNFSKILDSINLDILIFNNDILNNPNASTSVELTLSKNRDAYNLFDDFVKSLGDPKGMLGGGKVDMMPLKYEI